MLSMDTRVSIIGIDTVADTTGASPFASMLALYPPKGALRSSALDTYPVAGNVLILKVLAMNVLHCIISY
jgi:hypothetical protein